MSNKLIYDRENLYVMILLFKKEQKEKKTGCVGAVFSTIYHHIFMCLHSDINPEAITVVLI